MWERPLYEIEIESNVPLLQNRHDINMSLPQNEARCTINRTNRNSALMKYGLGRRCLNNISRQYCNSTEASLFTCWANDA